MVLSVSRVFFDPPVVSLVPLPLLCPFIKVIVVTLVINVSVRLVLGSPRKLKLQDGRTDIRYPSFRPSSSYLSPLHPLAFHQKQHTKPSNCIHLVGHPTPLETLQFHGRHSKTPQDKIIGTRTWSGTPFFRRPPCPKPFRTDEGNLHFVESSLSSRVGVPTLPRGISAGGLCSAV